MTSLFERLGMIGRGRLFVVALLVGLIGFVGTLSWRRMSEVSPVISNSPFTGMQPSPEMVAEPVKSAEESEKPAGASQQAALADQPLLTAPSAPAEVTGPTLSPPASDAKPEVEPSAAVTAGKPLETATRPAGLFVDPRDQLTDGATPKSTTAPEALASVPTTPPAGGTLFRDERAIVAPEGVRTSDSATVAAPVASPVTKSIFQDTRGLSEKPASEVQRDSGKPQFQDTRDIPGGAAGNSQGGAPKPQFQENRNLSHTGLSPRSLETPGSGFAPTPGFRDERTIAQPQFKDNRSTDTVRFSDQRTAPSSMFQDQRIAQERPSAAASGGREQPTQVARAPQSAQSDTGRPVSSESGRATIVTISPQDASGSDLRTCGEPAVATEALSAGQMRIKIIARCKANEPVQIRYGGAEFVRQLDAFGTLDFVLDCFVGETAAAELRFANGSRQALPVKALDLDRVSKIAVTWRAPVNLDLHVFEYGAKIGTRGHIWAKLASSLQMAREASIKSGRGSGFLSAVDNDDSLGDKLEVYTFFHNDEQSAGTIALALDYETRGATPTGPTCGDGELSEVEFRLTIMPRGGAPARQLGTLSRVDCGKPLSEAARFASSALPGLRIRR